MNIPLNKTEINNMKRAEVTQLLEQFGVAFSPAWTSEEMKEVAKANIFPKTETAALRAMASVKSMKKAELLKKADDLQAYATPRMSVPQLRTSIRKKILETTAPEGGDYMGFGTHWHKTYQQMIDSDPGYVEWALRACSNNSCPEMKRFVSWLNARATTPQSRATADLMTAAPLGQQDEGTTLSQMKLEDDQAQTELQEVRQAMTAMMGTIQQLGERLTNLEIGQSHKASTQGSAASGSGFEKVESQVVDEST